MRHLLPCVCCFILVISNVAADDVTDIRNRINKLQQTTKTLARKLILEQFDSEERTRSSGASGLRRIRLNSQGTQPNETPTFADSTFAAIHDHPHTERTVGMGEIAAVLNGVDFRTRHLDYKLMMKSNSSSEYGALEDIQFPPVPPEVLKHSAVPDQVTEMKEWFKAWRDQDYSVRDYTDFFKPVLCYLEGTWINSDETTIEELPYSDSHHLDARSWLDLQEKIRFTSYTGSKDIHENLGYLPTTVKEVAADGTVSMAQWSFHVLCHPLDNDLATSRLTLVDDIQSRMTLNQTYEEFMNSMMARFRLPPVDKTMWKEKTYRRGLLDQLMEQIPGLDGYKGHIVDDSFNDVMFPLDDKGQTPLNVAKFQRWAKSLDPGAMGLTARHRGFGDETIFVAFNTQDKVAGASTKTCEGSRASQKCKMQHKKVSYAIPLEIIYLTPLSSWNPYKLQNKGHPESTLGRTAFEGPNGKERTGKATTAEAYDGTTSNSHYLTPENFLQDPDSVHVLDKGGNIRKTFPSGIKVFLDIKDLGKIRQRYPIMNLHEEGGSSWKHLEALQDIVLQPSLFDNMLRMKPAPCSCTGTAEGESTSEGDATQTAQEDTNAGGLILKTNPSSDATGSHIHKIVLSASDLYKVQHGGTVETTTDEANGYKHEVNIRVQNRINPDGSEYLLYVMSKCDHQTRCRDGHKYKLSVVTN